MKNTMKTIFICAIYTGLLLCLLLLLSGCNTTEVGIVVVALLSAGRLPGAIQFLAEKMRARKLRPPG